MRHVALLRSSPTQRPAISQVSTDGFKAYQDAMVYSLGMHQIDFAQVIKIYANNPEGETRYSPAKCTGFRKEAITATLIWTVPERHASKDITCRCEWRIEGLPD
jgi:hypothetical protein